MTHAELPYYQNPAMQAEEEQQHLLCLSDIKHFAFFYHKYYKMVFRFVYQRTNSKENTADITSQVFLKAMQNIKQFSFKGVPFGAWLMRIAMNEILQEVRLNNKFQREYNYQTLDLISILDDTNDEAPSTYPTNTEELLSALKQLKEDDMNLIEMKYFEKRPYEEIQHITGIEINALKVRIHRIKKKLAELILSKTIA